MNRSNLSNLSEHLSAQPVRVVLLNAGITDGRPVEICSRRIRRAGAGKEKQLAECPVCAEGQPFRI